MNYVPDDLVFSWTFPVYLRAIGIEMSQGVVEWDDCPVHNPLSCRFPIHHLFSDVAFYPGDSMKLEFLTESFSICQLSPDRKIPEWCSGSFMAIVRTPDELSVIVASNLIPAGLEIVAQHDFCCFRVIGNLEFDVIGVIAKISKALAEAQIPILSISTFNTDYFLVANVHRDQARVALHSAGIHFA